MTRFLFKRIVLFLPTLFIVVLIAFFLSKLVPGDPVESLMTMQGISPESPIAGKEYARIYHKLHLNEPIFYFSVLPNFYGEYSYDIPDKEQRELTDALLKQKIPYSLTEEYIRIRKVFLSQSRQDSISLALWSDLIRQIQFEKDINVLSQLSAHSGHENSTIQSTMDKLLKTIQLMGSSRVQFYYPVFRWHGTSNQFHNWLRNIILGDFGFSVKDGRAVLPKIGTALQFTLLLAITGLILSAFISIPLGLWAGIRRNSLFDRLFQVFGFMLYAIPVFWLASLLIIYFTSDRYGYLFNIFPPPGLWYIPQGQSVIITLLRNSNQLILPIICMVANDIAPLSMIVRNNVIHQQSKPYVMTAYAKGLSKAQTLYRHIFPNVLLPLITILGGRLAAGISGALIIEVIFNIPGMGRLMYDSIYTADWNVVLGILIVISTITIAVLTITDLMYAWADPRIRTQIQKR